MKWSPIAQSPIAKNAWVQEQKVELQLASFTITPSNLSAEFVSPISIILSFSGLEI